MSACECPVSVQCTDEQHSLLAAFSSFTEAAGTLEQSYNQLQAEVARLREQLRAANAELEHQREAQERFKALAEISTLLAHEIRNPLGSLELFASLLAETELPAEPRRWIRQIQAGLRVLSATVNNVLNLHSNALELVATDIGELLHWTTEFLRPLAEQSGVRIDVLNDLKGVMARVDSHRFQQVLLNVALNAFYFSPRGGRLQVSGSVSQGRIFPTSSLPMAPAFSFLPISWMPAASKLPLRVCHAMRAWDSSSSILRTGQAATSARK